MYKMRKRATQNDIPKYTRDSTTNTTTTKSNNNNNNNNYYFYYYCLIKYFVLFSLVY